ncbi:MAG: PEGA domain-containing protein [Methanospirillum sp.]
MRAALVVLGISLVLALVAPCMAATPVGGSIGAFLVKCPVDGAKVWFDNDYKGQIANGMLSVPVYSTGTPYQTYRVEADGYEPFIDTITDYPAAGTIVTLQADLVKSPVGGTMGTYRFTANVEGAYVFLDGSFQGVIQNGVLLVSVYTTGTPFRNYVVQAPGYVSASGVLPSVPAAGQTITIPVTLSPRATPTPIGGGRGAYLIYCPVDGAMVSLDGDSVGTIQNGELFVPVYVTGTPYKTIHVTASGYQPYSAAITRYPAAGEVVNLYAFPDPITPTPTQSLIGGDMGYYLVHSNAEGARVYFDSDYKGNITSGVLNVPVYTTGTPYRTWSVVKEGYATFNGTISTYPSKGQTIDLQATLTLLPTTVPTTNATTAVPTTTKAPLSAICIAGALLSLAALGLAGRRH